MKLGRPLPVDSIIWPDVDVGPIRKQVLMSVICGEVFQGVLPSDEVLNEVLRSLNHAQQFVIKCRFGTNGMTLKQVAAIYVRSDGLIGVTPERVRQIEVKARRMLRHPSRSIKLGIS